MRSLIILGTGGSAHDVIDIVEAINLRAPTWKVAGFLDDTRAMGSRHLGFDVLGRICDAARFEDQWFINVIGSDRSYRQRVELIASTGVLCDRFPTLVHPAASVSSRAKLGNGVCVNFGVSIAGGVVIGDHVGLCPGVIVGHDTVIDDHALLAPGAILSGFVQIGQAAYIGSGSKIRQRVKVGRAALVGLGAVVLRDVPDGSTVVGNPARPLRRAVAVGQSLISSR